MSQFNFDLEFWPWCSLNRTDIKFCTLLRYGEHLAMCKKNLSIDETAMERTRKVNRQTDGRT